ncbi:patatin-like phospholipase family protein [Acanthopleuribacter pedis]|uniref:Patatin-like phospholipase family protein n=1 Tax=Acanthopleuribacter pedis TaxID=442870 RepID=A0A8J7QIH4_9BACT|nr:patatin-like phospholipase family protein [Acanthopleuribacter pedis]MBO1318850.1 patatin-like phospholipase family protein [Acanthopleuribacter pedis]
MTAPLTHHEGIYLALGGGAARGFAHLGIIRALQEHQIPIAGICGTSMGAVVGACFSLNQNADQVTRDFASHLKSDKFNNARFKVIQAAERGNDDGRTSFAARMRHGILVGRSLTTGAILPFDEFRSEISAVIPDRTFKQTQIPFFALACDLLQAREVVFNDGYLRSAIMASAAIPGVFPGVLASDRIYIDGGWINKIPVRPLLHMGAKHVIAVDVSDDYTTDFNPKRGFSMINQANKVAQLRLLELQTEPATLHWRPPVKEIHWSAFTQIERAVEIGYEYAVAHMDQVKKLLEPPPKPTWWQKLKIRLADQPQQEPPEPRPTGFDVRGIWDIRAADDDYIATHLQEL